MPIAKSFKQANIKGGKYNGVPINTYEEKRTNNQLKIKV